MAGIVTGLCFGSWSKIPEGTDPGWWSNVTSVLPNVLGFTLGAFALLLSLSSNEFGAFLSKVRANREEVLQSYLGQLAVAFVHFILMQILAIVLALVAGALNEVPPISGFKWLASDYVRFPFWGFCFGVFVYALMCSVAAAEWTFRCVRWLIQFQRKEQRDRSVQQLKAEKRRAARVRARWQIGPGGEPESRE